MSPAAFADAQVAGPTAPNEAGSAVLRRGGDFDRQCRRDSLPDMGEDALPAFTIDARIVEPALARPALRQMAAARVQILAFPAGVAQRGAGLVGFAPDRVVFNVLDGIAANMGFRRGRSVAGDAQHIER